MNLYSVKNWGEYYEKAQTRKVVNAQWVAVPLKHDGKSFRRLMAMENGVAIYGAWILILQVAAKCTVRGVLEDDDGPLTAEDLSYKTGCPQQVFEEALQVLCSEQVPWMKCEPIPSHCNAMERSANPLEQSANALQLQDSTGQDITEQNTTEAVLEEKLGPTTHASMIPIPPSLDTPPFNAAWQRWLEHLRQKGNRPSQLTLCDQLAELAKDPEDAVLKINHSIRQGYVGIYAPSSAKPKARIPQL